MENKMVQTIVKVAVENGIRYIKDNPKRGVRNLLDLGEYFASGRFQKVFFDLAHEILNNEDSYYYEIIEDLVKNTNHNNLTVFGINLGYNSFTYGANIIRENEKKHGYNIPWSIVFNFEEESANNLTGEEILNIISSGKNIGIYSYMIMLGKNDMWDILFDAFDEYNDCAFTLFVDQDIINEEMVKKISNTPNLCTIVLIENFEIQNNDNTTGKFNMLRKHKCLYGGYYRYDDSNAVNITNGTASSFLASMNLNFAAFMKKTGCSDRVAQSISEYILNTRIKINSPMLFIDFFGDHARVDEIISEEQCFLSINSDGQVCVSNIANKTKHNIRNASLEEILEDTMPEVKYI